MSRSAYHRDVQIGDDPVAVNEQKLHHEQNIKSNDRFVLAMANAVKRGKERAVPGTTVDLTEPIYHKRFRPELSVSSCGSPSAMCIESGGVAQGAQAMKRSPSYG